MNWFAVWVGTLLRRVPEVVHHDAAERQQALARQRAQAVRLANLELLERELDTYRRRDAPER